MKKLDWLILIILILSPIFINYGVLGICLGIEVNGSLDGWLGFYGTLVGSLVTMFVLYRTRIWNQDDNKVTREYQNKVLHYQEKRLWLQSLRQQLDYNYKILDFHNSMMAANDILSNKEDEAMKFIAQQSKNIEMQSFTFDIYLSNEQLSEFRRSYEQCYQTILKKYGDFINDLILICTIKKYHKTIEDIKAYLNSQFVHYDNIKSEKIKVNSTTFMNQLHELVNNKCTFEDINSLYANRISEAYIIQIEKIKLAEATRNLLRYEEREIEKILK